MHENNSFITEFLQDKQAALVGFADLSEIDSEVRQGLPYGICAAIALRVFPPTGSHPSIDYYEEHCKLIAHRNKLTEELIAAVTERGYRAVNAATPQYESFRTALPLKTIATRAGLGWIGKSATLITKEYGNAVRLVGILTDMPFETATPIDESRCGACEECVKHCPKGAIKGNLWRVGTDRNDLLDPSVCMETAIIRGKGLNISETSMCDICISVCPWTRRYMKKVNAPKEEQNVTLSIATAEDAPAMAEIQKAAFKRLYNQYHDESSPYLRGAEDILSRLPLPQWHVYKILCGDELVGGIYISEKEDDSYYLNRVFVHPDMQSRSIASRAILLAEKLLPRRPKWTVDFPSDQPMNRRCYEKAGFTDTGKLEAVSEGLVLALYEKQG
ncbi:MAG: GNAT family N-acetyltransferase [Oscillospiraceae bacterium]|jgi:Fe-S-cluster-containing hydrogenase component 2|nr:GNAT family N-acetyltransferase [Oscillospiraceae bacterium]